VQAYYADGTRVNPFIYSVHQEARMKRLSEGDDPIPEFVRSVRFDIEHEAEWKLKKSNATHKIKPVYKPASCKVSIPKGKGLQKYQAVNAVPRAKIAERNQNCGAK
jgi:hypothetical protein